MIFIGKVTTQKLLLDIFYVQSTKYKLQSTSVQSTNNVEEVLKKLVTSLLVLSIRSSYSEIQPTTYEYETQEIEA